MVRALVVGEALVDVVLGADGEALGRHPGGSPANVALGLARVLRRVLEGVRRREPIRPGARGRRQPCVPAQRLDAQDGALAVLRGEHASLEIIGQAGRAGQERRHRQQRAGQEPPP